MWAVKRREGESQGSVGVGSCGHALREWAFDEKEGWVRRQLTGERGGLDGLCTDRGK